MFSNSNVRNRKQSKMEEISLPPGLLTSRAKRMAQNIFSLCDVDDKGFITMRDLEIALSEYSELCLTPEQVEYVFSLLDTQRSGRLHRDQFVSAFERFLMIDHSQMMLGTGNMEDGLDEMYESQTPPVSPDILTLQAEWDSFLRSVGGNVLLEGNNDLQGLWQRLRQDEPELLRPFEVFLRNAICEIYEMQTKCDSVVRSKSMLHSQEVKRLYEEMEVQLSKEREKIRVEVEERMRVELARKLEEKDDQLRELNQRRKELELMLKDLDHREKEKDKRYQELEGMIAELTVKEAQIMKENEVLQRENLKLQAQLDESLHSLEESQELCIQMQEKLHKERALLSRDFEDAVMENERKAKERDDLEFQLQKLKQKMSEERADELSKIAHEVECDTTSQTVRTPDRCFKIILVGDSGVGKTSFIHRFCKNTFSPKRQVTVGIGYYMKTMVTANTIISLQIWDTAGQERFRSIPNSYFRKVDGVMLLYDLTCEESFKNVNNWMQDIQTGVDEGNATAVTVLVANKHDLAEKHRIVSEAAGRNLAKEYDALFVETSAKLGTNVAQSFEILTRKLQEREDEQIRSLPIDDRQQQEALKRKKKCC
ncbi:EF-hand calcium-binding domain-containing protein 4B-like isoform X1 [Branchiostoma lanceolatum]|uniref:EF-hand calcium-binding domain-containing protein 4B-like isoform X1 n=2 Tax=Branchiostoma lanceolatum TaxID=7740 RepID=UPI00345170B3